MKQPTENKNNVIFNLLLPLCKNKEGNFDQQKTDDCKKMLKNWGIFLMALGTILMVVGFVGMAVKQTALSTKVVWLWVAVAFGTLFTCLGIATINMSTNVVTYVKNKLNAQTEDQE